MGQIYKLIERLQAKPKDFTFQETINLLNHFGYKEKTGGKTSDSRVTFVNKKHDYIRIHKPHPRNVLKPYQVTNLLNDLEDRGLLC